MLIHLQINLGGRWRIGVLGRLGALHGAELLVPLVEDLATS